MMANRKSLIVVGIFICISILCAGCEKGQDELKQPLEETPQQTLQNFSTQHTEAGVLKWTLTADSAEFLKEVVSVRNPTLQIFQEGQVAITITGERGEIIQSTNNIKVFSNIVGVSRDGKLYTDELHWRNQEGKLYAPNESRIVRGDSTMVGQEMECNPSLEAVTMKNVQFKIYPKDEKSDAPE